VARQEIQSVGGAPEPLGAAAVCVAAVWALGVLWAGVPTFAILWAIFRLCAFVIQVVEHQAVGTAQLSGCG